MLDPVGQQHDDSNLVSEAASCGATTSSAGPATARATAGLPTAATSTGPFRRTTAKQSYYVSTSTETVSGSTEAATSIFSGIGRPFSWGIKIVRA